MSVPGRRMLITGSSGSLGARLGAHFLQAGWTVVGFDLAAPTPSADPVHAGSSPDANKRWRFVACDLTDSERLQQVLTTEMTECGPFDAVINNVGLIYSAPLLTFANGGMQVHDFAAWNRVLAVTLSATFYVTALTARAMAAAGRRGVIVNISSVCAAGNAGQAAYSAAKAGVNALTCALAKELGPLGIRVAAVAPGFLDTESNRQSMTEAALARVRAAVPLRRLGAPADLCHAVKFVLENDYFHGKVLELDGGLTL